MDAQLGKAISEIRSRLATLEAQSRDARESIGQIELGTAREQNVIAALDHKIAVATRGGALTLTTVTERDEHGNIAQTRARHVLDAEHVVIERTEYDAFVRDLRDTRELATTMARALKATLGAISH